MNGKKILYGIGVVLIFTFSPVGLSMARQIDVESKLHYVLPDPAASFPWYAAWADETTSTEVGAYPSIAYSWDDKLPYISYYDVINGNLMLAHFVPDGSGNCGSDGLWDCEVVDGDGLNGHSNHDVGKYSSLDFFRYSNTLIWNIGISYYDATDRVLKFAEYSYIPHIGESWDYVTITPPLSGTEGDGLYTSFKYNQDGYPQIAYYSQRFFVMYTFSHLSFAAPVSNGGNCGYGDDAGKWECTQIESDTGKFASLDIDYDDRVYIAYYDDGSDDLKYAFYIGSGGNCDNGWDCYTVDDTGNVGSFASIKAKQNSTDKIRIAYFDATNGALRYASSNWGSDGNCGPGDSWYCMDVDDMGAGTGMTQAGVSMEIDNNGLPIIAYQDASIDLAPAKLNIARPAYIVAGTGGIGNCGDALPDELFHYWYCKTIDDASYGKGNVSVAEFVSLAVNSHGISTIAYVERDDYNMEDALKVAYNRIPVYLPLTIR